MLQVEVNNNNPIQSDQARLTAVIQFANNVLEHGRDRYRADPTPLFADGINTHTGAHIRWVLPGGRSVVISNLACQQNLLRTMVTLSMLTGDERFKAAAQATVAYHFEHLTDPSGLLQWGGHRFIDLESLEAVGPEGKGMVHELKNALPFYELMNEVDPAATAKYIRAFWNAHIYDWEGLYMGRHGKYGLELGKLWDHPLLNLPPFRESTGLSFLNAGNDLIYAACMMYRFNGDEQALRWGKHLAYQYVAARDPQTGLGTYQFTQPQKTDHTDDDNDTRSWFGDRAQRQFGPEFGPAALEGKLLLGRMAGTIYCENALLELELARTIGSALTEFREWTHAGLRSFAESAYLPETNQFRTMFINGTDLTGYALRRNGYYGKAGQQLTAYPADHRYLASYARAYYDTQDPLFWQMVRSIAKGNGLGELGDSPNKPVQINQKTDCSDYRALYAALDLYRATGDAAYLGLGRIIGNNMINKFYHQGYFKPTSDQAYAKFDRIEPLALLALEAAIQGKLDQAPVFITSQGFIHGRYQFPDGRVVDLKDYVLYGFRRDETDIY